MATDGLALTPRGLGALLGVLLVLVLAFYTANVLAYLLGVFSVSLVLGELLLFERATRGFSAAAFSAERLESSAFVRVGSAAALAVRVVSRLPGEFYAEIVDLRPPPLEVVEGSPRLLTWWPAGTPLSVAYVVTPRVRGLFEVGPTVVVAHDPFGFAQKTARLDTPWQLEAIPSPLEIPVGHPHRIVSPVVGTVATPFRGPGAGLHALREYQSTDDPRQIAWSRSTQGTLYVRETDRDSQQDLLVVLDTGRGMASGRAYDDALERSVEAASVALRQCFEDEGRAGVAVVGERLARFVPPGRGTDHEFQLLRTLTSARLQPRPAGLAEALLEVGARLGRPTHLLIFSSLEGDPARIVAALAGLERSGHRPYVLAPDVRAMFPAPVSDVARRGFGLVIEAEAGRVDRAAAALRNSGVPLERFGREDAVGAVGALYRNRSGTGG